MMRSHSKKKHKDRREDRPEYRSERSYQEEEGNEEISQLPLKKEDSFRPPYTLEELDDDHPPPYGSERAQPLFPEWKNSADAEDEEGDLSEEQDLQEKAQGTFELQLKAIAALLTGAFFFMFGLVLALFSNDGKLTLTWNSHYWPFYLLLALGLIALGWRALQQIDES